MTRAIVAALLAASSFLPGVAAAQDRGDRSNQGERQARAERRADRDQSGGATRERDRPVRDAGVGRPDRPDRPDQRSDRPDQRPDRPDQRPNRPDRPDDRGQGSNRPGNDRGGYDRRDEDRGGGWAQRGNGRPQNDWRRDGRYDWNRYRAGNRQAFRLPRYYAPGGRGYGYRRFGVGARIAGAFFGRNYWIADPWAYRLPPAYGPYRWVRYYNDAALVDVRTGFVVDVIHDIFW